MGNKAKIRRRQRCPECGSLDVIKWGIRNGIQRLRCRNCKSLFSVRRKDISKTNRFPWFRKWVSGRMTIEEISASSGYSGRQLHRWFDEYLDEYPTWTIETHTPVYLLIDGTYYSDNHCLIVYRAENMRRTLFYRFTRAVEYVYPDVPRTTNSLEAFFGHVKDQLRLHRGLSETRVDNFIKWYLYFNDEKKKNR